MDYDGKYSSCDGVNKLELLLSSNAMWSQQIAAVIIIHTEEISKAPWKSTM